MTTSLPRKMIGVYQGNLIRQRSQSNKGAMMGIFKRVKEEVDLEATNLEATSLEAINKNLIVDNRG